MAGSFFLSPQLSRSSFCLLYATLPQQKMYGLNATGCFEVTGVEELWRKATVEYNNVTEVTTVYLTIMVSEEGGVITIAPIAGHATDLAGNLNTVANTLTFEIGM